MGIEIVKQLTPEEEELAAKRKELARLEAQPVAVNRLQVESERVVSLTPIAADYEPSW